MENCETQTGRMNCRTPRLNRVNAQLDEFEFLKPKPRGFQPTEDASGLSVRNVKMYENQNKVAHHTEKYDNKFLIVRRGQEFIMGIVFNRPLNPQEDVVLIEFVIGSTPTATQGTLITMGLGQTNQPSGWKCVVVETSENETRVAITPAPDCIIGLFSTYVTIVTSIMKQRTKRSPETDFYVLCNPWAPLDQVFIASEMERTEYVLNDAGVMYDGVLEKISRRPWSYGQFKHGVLDACLFVLDFGNMPLEYRGDIGKLVRKASAMMNSQDDNGVLVGNWSEDFKLGTAPTAWTGSSEILLSYASKGGVPVKYAQCWVYAGTLNTFLRCLGMPTRVITNFRSAHDNMGSLKTNIVFDVNGRMDTRRTTDSVWNYHCWNEVFMKRTDIPEEFSGWQVVDSTPQEISDGYYRCGPTSVKAIKEGELSYQFDARFVYAEVRSDVIFQQDDGNGNSKITSVLKDYVGKLIVTKTIGSSETEDITYNYKYPVDTPDYTKTKERAESLGMTTTHTTTPAPDVQLQLEASQMDNYDINLTLSSTNQSNDQRTLNLTLTAKMDYYTGSTRTVFKYLTDELRLDPLQTKQGSITITAEEYRPYLQGQPFLSFFVFGSINETGLSLTTMDVLHLDIPPLLIEVSGNPKVGGDMYVTVKFTNTTGSDLNDVSLRMEGSGLLPMKKKKYSQITQGSSVKWIETFTPQLPGEKVLVACLDCYYIRNLCGQVDIAVKP